MSTESIENVGSPSEVENQFGWPRVCHPLDLQKQYIYIILIEEHRYLTTIIYDMHSLYNLFYAGDDAINRVLYLTVGKGSYGHIPCSISGHHEA